MERLGQLDCRIVAGPDGGSNAIPNWSDFELIVILCHGYGAPGDDLVPLAHELGRFDPQIAEKVAFVFPAAPIILERIGGFESRAWWPIDMERLQIAKETELVERLRKESPPELPSARQKLESVIKLVSNNDPARKQRVILGGFSQGAMLSTDTALSQAADAPVGGLILYSGTLLKEKDWKQLAADAPSLEIVQSHGVSDPILPFANAVALRDLLNASGHRVDFLEFEGVHTIPSEALIRLAKFINRKLN